MAAPKGNKFWEARSTHGRAPIFATPADLWSAAVEYFEWVEANPLEEAIVYQGELNEKHCKPLMRAMTVEGLCVFLDISRETFYAYQDKGKDFSDIITRIGDVMRSQKFSGAAAGLLNANIIARDLGLKDATTNEHTGAGGAPLSTTLDVSKLTLEALKEVMAAVNATDESGHNSD